jgi:ribonuclease-3
MQQPSLSSLEHTIGYRFKNRYLLECALTHSSFANEQKIHKYSDYERLEFLGDAVLEMISSAFLFHKYPDMKEGRLSKLRASLVCEAALSACARDLGLSEYIRFGKGAEAAGARNKDTILCDVTEALIGAMYLDSDDIPTVRKFVVENILNDIDHKQYFYDGKSILQEEVQRQGQTIRYEILEKIGPEHQAEYVVGLYIDEILVTKGRGTSKKAAEQEAAYQYLTSRHKT